MIEGKTISELEALSWVFRTIFVLLLGVVTWIMKKSIDGLERVQTQYHDHERRLSIVEVLVEQHDAQLERYGLEKLVRRRIAEEEKQ